MSTCPLLLLTIHSQYCQLGYSMSGFWCILGLGKWLYSDFVVVVIFFPQLHQPSLSPLLCKSVVSTPQSYSDAVDEWLILSKRNFKFDLGDVLLLPSAVGLRHMMTGVPDPWLSTLRAGLKAEEEDAMEG